MEDVMDDIEDDNDLEDDEHVHVDVEENTGTCFPSKSFMT